MAVSLKNELFCCCKQRRRNQQRNKAENTKMEVSYKEPKERKRSDGKSERLQRSFSSF